MASLAHHTHPDGSREERITIIFPHDDAHQPEGIAFYGDALWLVLARHDEVCPGVNLQLKGLFAAPLKLKG